MDIKIINDTKDEVEVIIGNLTIVELLRVYLNKDSAVTFAAWKRDHPTDAPTLLIKTKGKVAKKALNDAINAVVKDLDGISKDFKSMK